MSNIVWLYLAVLVLAPALRWVGLKLFRAPSVSLAADPGPLIDSAPTTVGTTFALARMHTVTVLALGLILLPAVGVVVVFIPIVLLVEWLGHDLPRSSPSFLFVLYALLAGAGVTLSFRWRSKARRAGVMCFEVYRDRVRLPVTSESSLSARYVTVPLASVRSVDAPGNGGLVIDTSSETYVLPSQILADPSSIPRLREAIVAQLRLLPSGAEVLARSERAAAAMREFAARPAWVTSAVLALCAVAFVVQLFVGMGAHALLRLGANVRPLTWHGDWYRLFTASFLHVGFWHLLFNLSFISALGGLVERTIGPVRFLVVYLLSGVIGSALGSAFDFMSAGASTSAFGILGALSVLQYRYGDALPAGFRLHATRWVVLVGINAALPFLFPNISWSGHVGGLVGGALTCALIASTPESLAGKDAPGGVRAAAGLLVVAQLGAFSVAAHYAWSDDDFETAFLEALARDPRGSPPELNDLAWSIVVDRAAPMRRLKAAVKLAERAVESGGPEEKDTLAQALHRIGDEDGAVRRETQAVLEAGKSFHATQLLRFLAARLQREKAPLVEPGVGDPTALQPALRIAAQGRPRATMELPTPVARTLVVYSIGHPIGLLEVCVAAGAAGPREARVEGDNVPPGASFEVGYVGASACPVGRARFFTAADPTVKDLP